MKASRCTNRVGARYKRTSGRWWALWLILSLICSTAAFAGTASIVSSFKSPSSYPAGIAYYYGYLYHTRSGQAIYETTTAGSITNSIPCIRVGYALDRTVLEFWSVSGSIINRISTGGSLLRSFYGPVTNRDIAYGGGFLWVTASTTYIYKLTVNGSAVNRWLFSGCNPTGICYDDGALWLAERSRGEIWNVTTAGSIIGSYDIPQTPWGVATDGEYIWYSVYADGYVYKMLPLTTGIAPASLGKVKVVYR